MPAPKSRKGSAYISILAATMLIIMLAAVILSITAVSRRLTAHYSDYIGLYDLAVAGNEQALFLLIQSLDANRNDISYRAWQQLKTDEYIAFIPTDGGLKLDTYLRGEFGRIFIEKAMNALRDTMHENFNRHLFMYQLEWGIDTIIDTSTRTIMDSYSAVTTLYACETCFRFHIDTGIRRYTGDDPGTQAIVEATINWRHAGLQEMVLDAYTMFILKSAGTYFPDFSNPPAYGENLILFLDGFTLQMLESLRIQIGIHPRRREAWGC